MFSPISRSLWIDFNSDPSASDPTIYQLRKIGLSILVPWASVSALFTWQGFRPNWIDPPALKEQVSRNAPPQSFSCPPLARLPFSSRSDKGNLGGGVREVKGRRPRGITQHARRVSFRKAGVSTKDGRRWLQPPFSPVSAEERRSPALSSSGRQPDSLQFQSNVPGSGRRLKPPEIVWG